MKKSVEEIIADAYINANGDLKTFDNLLSPEIKQLPEYQEAVNMYTMTPEATGRDVNNIEMDDSVSFAEVEPSTTKDTSSLLSSSKSGASRAGSGGSSSSDMINTFTDLGDKLHKNFSANLDSAIQAKQWNKQFEFQKENAIYNRLKQLIDDRERYRNTLFQQNMLSRQEGMSEREAMLRNQATELGIRRAIEDNNDKENITKNFLAGMMKSLGGKNG